MYISIFFNLCVFMHLTVSVKCIVINWKKHFQLNIMEFD